MQPRCAAGAAQRSLASASPIHLSHALPQTQHHFSKHHSVRNVHARSGAIRGVISQTPRLGASRSRRSTVQTQAFFSGWFKSDPSEATRKKYQSRVDVINSLEIKMSVLTDEQLQAKTVEFKQRVAGGETLEALLPEAFAVSWAHRCDSLHIMYCVAWHKQSTLMWSFGTC